MQVTLPGESGGMPNHMLEAMREMNARNAETRFPFGSLKPLWGRQVPCLLVSRRLSPEQMQGSQELLCKYFLKSLLFTFLGLFLRCCLALARWFYTTGPFANTAVACRW